jgi:hypothetical protein
VWLGFVVGFVVVVEIQERVEHFFFRASQTHPTIMQTGAISRYNIPELF